MTPAEADRASRNSALTLALTLPGDTLLYLLLPLHAAAFGVSLPEAGFLLAANRLVRIAGYGWVARFYANRGPRTACTIAALAAAIAAFGYATLSGVWALTVARLMWGLSYAAMNIATQALPTAVIEGASVRSGRARSIVALGPAIGLLVGAVVDLYFGPRVVFVMLGCISLIAPFFALTLPRTPEAISRDRPKLAWPQPISIWSFWFGFVMDGLFIFGLSLIAKASYPAGAVLAAGAAMALRYVSEVVLSAPGGSLGQKFGARRMLILLSFVTAATLSLLAAPAPILWIGIIATVVIRALASPLPAPVIADANPGPARVPALARQAVWRDLGAGAGPLAAGFLFASMPSSAIFLIGAVLLVVATLPLTRERPAGTAAP